MKFCVLGGGIIGLSTASELKSQFPSAQVTLIADKFEEETTSYGAAGIFRPGGGFSVSGDTGRVLPGKWLKDSWDYYYRLQCSPENPTLHGVKPVSGYMFSAGRDTTKNDLLQDLVPIYRSAREEELKICPGDWDFGSFYTTLVIDSSKHLGWLRSRLEGQVEVRKSKVSSWEELGGQFDCVFNCTGLGARWLCNDERVVPIRGQVFKIRAPWIKMFYYGNSDTYIIPGMDYVTLGGTRQFDNYNTQIDAHDSAGIWERCISLVPNLQASKVIREWAGLRPYRDGGVRAELEIVKTSRGQLKIIHNYGHGGYGVTFAPGSAKHSLRIFNESQRSFWRIWKSKI